MKKFHIAQYMVAWILCLLFTCQSTKVPESLRQTSVSDNRLSLLKLSDLEGKPIHLNQFTGKLIFLNFWATWCEPCKSEMKSIQEISKQFDDQIVFLMASNEDPLKIKNFMSRHSYDFQFIHLDMPFIDAFIVELPTTFLIDRNGLMISEVEGFRIWSHETQVHYLKNLVMKSSN